MIYQLQAFNLESSFSVVCQIKNLDPQLIVTYEVLGPIDKILLPNREQSGHSRKDELWKETCFELFIKSQQTKNYLELNVSPSGDWNLYEFSDYRVGQTPSNKLTHLISKFFCNNLTLKCQFEVPLTIIESFRPQVLLGLSCVLKHTTGKLSYWAVQHPKEKPDFHLDSHFVLYID